MSVGPACSNLLLLAIAKCRAVPTSPYPFSECPVGLTLCQVRCHVGHMDNSDSFPAHKEHMSQALEKCQSGSSGPVLGGQVGAGHFSVDIFISTVGGL